MKSISFLLFVFVILTNALHSAPLKVIFWNLEWFPGHRPTASATEADEHMEAAQKILKTLNPDVFVGVEIRDWAAFHELVSVVPSLSIRPRPPRSIEPLLI